MGHRAATVYALSRWLGVRGFEQNRKKSSRPFKGLRLRTTDDDHDGGLL
jgi:hypothetical protein